MTGGAAAAAVGPAGRHRRDPEERPSAPAEQRLSLIDACLGTNLPFPTRGGGTSVPVGGVSYGIMPDCPKRGTPATPCTLFRQSVFGGARLAFEVRAPYDPSWLERLSRRR